MLETISDLVQIHRRLCCYPLQGIKHLSLTALTELLNGGTVRFHLFSTLLELCIVRKRNSVQCARRWLRFRAVSKSLLRKGEKNHDE